MQMQQIRTQELECTIEPNQHMADPFRSAEKLFEHSQKVRIPIQLGPCEVTVRAAIVDEKDLVSMFPEEMFAGIIGRGRTAYQFLNKDIESPRELGNITAKLMAFHCLAAIKVESFDDITGTVDQYQAIALEMAYARTLLQERDYKKYGEWRSTVERTDFFERKDWRRIVEATSRRFNELTFELQKNAHRAQFIVSSKERFMLKGNSLYDQQGNEIKFGRKTRSSRCRKRTVK